MLILVSSASSVFQLITVFLIFVFVLAITYWATKFIGDLQKPKDASGNIEIIETERISQNKYIQIVRIGEKYFAIAVCKDTVTTISEVSAESLTFSEEPTSKLTFKDFLKKAREEEQKEQEK